LLKLSRALVFPSHLRSEAFGVTLLEGAMMAKPLISTEIGTGTSYININGETGAVIAPANPVALRRAMDALYTDPAEARRLGLNARRRYERHFTAARMGRAYSDLYARIAGVSTRERTAAGLADST
jgi:glycosyltransferase involved in cell wall biosynthesis